MDGTTMLTELNAVNSNRVITLLARMYPWSVETDESLEKAITFLGWDSRPETFVRAGYATSVLIFLACALCLVSVPPERRPGVVVGIAGIGLGSVHVVQRGPQFLAAVRRTTALGDAPDLIARAALRMRLSPTAEVAAMFAARSGEGPLADSLGRHSQRSVGTPGTGFSGFAAEWSEWFPSLRRATLLLEAAADASSSQRERILERALGAVLDGTRREMARFIGEIRGPATALYAFGVLLPLALVAVLPAARAAGVPVTISALVFAYDVVLPITLLCASGWLLVRRPVAFPPPQISREHPSVGDSPWSIGIMGLLAGAGFWLALSRLSFPNWMRTIVPLGFVVGFVLTRWYKPHEDVRSHTRSIEEGLADAASLVGRRIEEGHAVEVAIEHAATDVAGPMGKILTDAAHTLEALPVSVHAAFLGDYGALSHVPSVRARSTAALFSIAATEGRPAGEAIVSLADHLAELQSVERAAQRDLETITGTIESTARLFGPGVAGATLALADGLARGSTVGSATALPPMNGLGVAVGVYVLLLSMILAALAAGLRHGLSHSVVGYRIGTALLASVAIYPLTYLAASALI